MGCILFLKYLLRFISFVLNFVKLFPICVSTIQYAIVFLYAQSNIESEKKWTLTDHKDMQTVQYILILSVVQVVHHPWELFQYLTQPSKQKNSSARLI